MLIQALTAHQAAHRATQTTEAAAYQVVKNVKWSLIIDADGTPTLEPLTGENGKPGVRMAVPNMTRSGTGKTAMLLADTLEYVLGVPALKGQPKDAQPSAANIERARQCHANFLTRVRAWADETGDPHADRILHALTGPVLGELRAPYLEPGAKAGTSADYAAILIGAKWAHQLPTATSYWASIVQAKKGSGKEGVCLACNTTGQLMDTVPGNLSAGLLPGAGMAGNAVFSINTAAQGRLGRKGLANTPICETCVSRTMEALIRLLDDKLHRHRSKDGVLIWWLQDPSSGFDPLSMCEDPKPSDVVKLLDRVRSGIPGTAVDDTAFYALSLAGTRARAVVRDWIDVPIRDVRASLASWFEGHAIADSVTGPARYMPLWLLAKCTGRWTGELYAADHDVHGIEAALLQTALRGTPPPPALVPHLLHRIRNDHRIDAPRAALLRLALSYPPYYNRKEQRMLPGLDPDQDHPAYLWGRAFALMVDIQTTAMPQVNMTIADKYLGMAMTRPTSTLAALSAGSQAHLSKIRRSGSEGLAKFLERELNTVTAAIPATLPRSLTIHDQAVFIIGYRAQRAAADAARQAARAAKTTNTDQTGTDTDVTEGAQA